MLTILVGFALASSAVSASSLLDSFTKDEAIDRITTYVPVKDNNYTCTQLVYNQSASKEAINICGFSRLSSAADTGYILCHSWGMLKGNDNLGNLLDVAAKAKADINESYAKSQNKAIACKNLLNHYSDFIIE